jgi:acyl-CoA reductase-like NAD-dependent aldehyde dehydrogenase
MSDDSCNVLRADEAIAIARSKSSGHVGCFYTNDMYNAIRKAAERGETTLIYVTEERNEWEAKSYVWNLYDKGYKAELIGRTFEGYYVLKIEW